MSPLYSLTGLLFFTALAADGGISPNQLTCGSSMGCSCRTRLDFVAEDGLSASPVMDLQMSHTV